MLVISAQDQKKVVNMKEMIDVVGVALREYSASRTITPIRTSISLSGAGGTALTMPALAESMGCLGVKFVTVFPENKQMGKKTIHGVMLVVDVETGEPQALLEGSCLTVLRTGALSGLATQYLSRADSKVLCVIGTGDQARGLVAAILAVRKIREIRLVNRNIAKARDFARELSEEYGSDQLQVDVFNADQGVAGADIVVTATNSDVPVFSADRIEPGVHINAVGSFRPKMQELPTQVILQGDKVVVESREAALEETGDLLIPMASGKFKPEQIYAELGEIVAGEKKGRQHDREITVFKSVGLAVADIVAANLIYEKVLEEGLGQKVSL